MLALAKRFVFVAATSLAAAFTVVAASPSEAEACGNPPAERVARDAVQARMPEVMVKDVTLTATDGEKATVVVVGGRDGKTVRLVARLVNDAETGWRVVSLSRMVPRKLKSLKA